MTPNDLAVWFFTGMGVGALSRIVSFLSRFFEGG